MNTLYDYILAYKEIDFMPPMEPAVKILGDEYLLPPGVTVNIPKSQTRLGPNDLPVSFTYTPCERAREKWGLTTRSFRINGVCHEDVEDAYWQAVDHRVAQPDFNYEFIMLTMANVDRENNSDLPPGLSHYLTAGHSNLAVSLPTGGLKGLRHCTTYSARSQTFAEVLERAVRVRKERFEVIKKINRIMLASHVALLTKNDPRRQVEFDLPIQVEFKINTYKNYCEVRQTPKQQSARANSL